MLELAGQNFIAIVSIFRALIDIRQYLMEGVSREMETLK